MRTKGVGGPAGRGVGAVAGDRAPVPRPQIFTVRLWYEVLDAGRGEWRGEVRHADGMRRAYFREWDRLVGFVQQVLADSERAAAVPGPRRGPAAGHPQHPQG